MKGSYNGQVYLPPGFEPGQAFPTLYILGEMDWLVYVMARLEPRFSKDLRPFVLIALPSGSWGDDFSPWPAPAVFKDQPPFGGHAKVFLDGLLTQTMPKMERTYGLSLDPSDTGLMGYSLSGLAALYALYQTPRFGLIGCLSGSLWYDGWLTYMKEHEPMNPAAKVYLSLGRKEPKTRNPTLSRIGDATKETYTRLGETLVSPAQVLYEINDGGHGSEVPQRFEKALGFLMKNVR